LLAVLVAVAALAGGGYLYTRTVTPKHAVPRLIGDTEAAANEVLAPLHLHLHVATRPYDDNVTSGLILRQQPDAGALREGSSVSVDVSAGPPPVVVPDLTNLTEDQARQRLAGAGLTTGQLSSRPDTTVTAGHVITWSGKDGKLIKGSSVDVILSSGPPTVVVPDVHAKSFADAKAALAAMQLTAVEDDQFNDTVPKGQVVATNPPVNTTVAVGTQVTVTVSKGIDLVTVPDVNQQSVAAATRALEQAGLSVSGVSGSPDRPVTSTSPPRGTMVKRGSPVKLFTS
jgi:serine/threonine-protein kinase